MKTALLVLGAHRSGTSPLTRVLNLLGADVSARLLPPAPGNALGFWEPADVVRLHDELLASAGTSWDDWRRFDPAWYQSPLAATYTQRLRAWLAQEFRESTLFVIKDPRMCRLFRLWREALSGFDAQIKVVIALRNPVEVARSLESRDHFPPAKSHLLWLRHLLDAVGDTRDVPRCVVSYDGLLRDWRKTVIDLTQRLDLTWPRPLSAVESPIDEFVSARERHHVVEDEEWLDRPDVVDWVKRAYRELASMAAGGPDDAAQAALDALAADVDTAIAGFGPLLQTRKEEGRLIAEIAARDRKLVEADRDLKRVGLEIEAREQRLIAADGEIRRLIGEVAAREQRLVEADSELRRLIGEVHRLNAEGRAREQRLVAVEGEIGRLTASVEERSQRLLAADGELRLVLLAVARRERQLAEVEGRLATAAAERQTLADDLHDGHQRLVEAERDRHRLSAEVLERDRRLRTAEERLRELETSTLWRVIGALRRFPKRS